jgi:hypothetical protein
VQASFTLSQTQEASFHSQPGTGHSQQLQNSCCLYMSQNEHDHDSNSLEQSGCTQDSQS